MIGIKQFSSQKNDVIFHWSDKSFKDTGLNRVFPYLQGGSLHIKYSSSEGRVSIFHETDIRLTLSIGNVKTLNFEYTSLID